ncbi:MAG: glycosyltransferase, partial [Planctomycetota bacterium]
TARWERLWPTEISIRDTGITRLPRPAGGPWGNFRFQRALSKYLSDVHKKTPLDGVFVFGAGQETETVRRIVGPEVNILTRLNSRYCTGTNWSSHHTRRILNAADVIATDTSALADKVRDSEVTTRTCVIPDIVCSEGEPFVERTMVSRESARRAISDAHPILSIEGDHPLIVSSLPMNGDEGLLDLIGAWPVVLKSYRNARLWLTGNGSFGRRVWDAITRRELIYNVIMPGYFDDVTELFLAADLYVHPARTDDACSMLTRAMNSGICVVSTENEFSQSLLTKNVSGMFVPRQNPHAMAEAIIHGIRNRDLRQRLGSSSRRTINETIPAPVIAANYLNLLSGNDTGAIQIPLPDSQQN